MTTQADGGGQTDVSCSSDVERDESVDTLRNDVEMAFTGQQPPMASPLSGGYLLIVLAEPHNEQHKDLILKRLAEGQFSISILVPLTSVPRPSLPLSPCKEEEEEEEVLC